MSGPQQREWGEALVDRRGIAVWVAGWRRAGGQVLWTPEFNESDLMT